MIKEIIINNLTHKVIMKKEDRLLGVKGENKFETLKFIFEDIFLNGEGILEIQKPNAQKEYIILEKEEDCYLLEVKNSLLNVEGEITMQLVVRTTDNRVFKSVEFTMQVLKAIEATEEIPDEYKTWDAILAEKILEINKKLEELNSLEDTLDTLLSNANLQVENVENLVEEATRLKEETEKLKEQIETALSEYDTKTDEKVSEFISTYNSKIEELNTLATNLTDDITSKANSLKTEFDKNAEAKTTTFNSNVETKTSEFNENAETKLDEYNSNDTAKIEAYNKNHEAKIKLYNDNDVSKTNAFNELVENSTNTFNSNVENKTTDFNNTVTEQTNTFNNNVTSKKAEINTLAETKITEYNENAEVKLNEFNENAESYEKRIVELEIKNAELAQQMPWNTTDIQESIHIEDSAKYSRNKLDTFGNLKQETRKGYNILSSYESQTNTTIYYNILYKNQKMKENTQYTISFKGKAGDKFRISAGTYGVATETSNITVDSNGVGIGHFKTRESFTSDSNGILSNFANNNTLPLTNICIAEGYYEELPFEPYGAMPSLEYSSMPVVATGVQKIKKLGKNLCDGINQNYYLYTNAKICGFNINNSGLIINVEKGQNYTISTLVIQERYRVACLNDIPLNFTGVTAYKGTNQDNTDNSITIDTTGYKYLVVNATDLNSIFIEQGDTATDYEPYKEEVINLDLGTTELCKITDSDGNVVAQDKFVNKDGKWQIERNITKDLLNSIINRSPKLIGSYLADGLIGFVFSANHKSVGQTIGIVSNKLKAKYLGVATSTTDINSVRNAEGIALHSGNTNQICVTLEKTRLETEDIEGIESFINLNNITCYYPSLKSTYEDCTPEQSAVLDKLYKLSLEKGTNNIFVESENGVTTELQLEYMQDRIMLEKAKDKELDDRITALEAMIVSNASEEV